MLQRRRITATFTSQLPVRSFENLCQRGREMETDFASDEIGEETRVRFPSPDPLISGHLRKVQVIPENWNSFKIIRSISPASLFACARLKPAVRITPSGIIGTVPGSRGTLRGSDDATPRTIRRQEGLSPAHSSTQAAGPRGFCRSPAWPWPR